MTTDLASLTPDAARVIMGARAMFGSVADAIEMLPDARAVRLLSNAFASLAPSPIYGRAPDAKIPA
jgi:hypothetical protein